MELCVLATERMMVLFYVRGVDQSAAASEIKKAYRRAALRHHPDKVYWHRNSHLHILYFFSLIIKYVYSTIVLHFLSEKWLYEMKASQSLARNENGDDALWKQIAEDARKDADRLFKMIGEAYAVLSDPSKVCLFCNF